MPKRERKFKFSNFQPFNITYQDVVYRSVEHLYQAMKFRDEDYRQMIADCPTAAKAKKTARILADSIRPDWDQLKLGVMRVGLSHKFAPGTTYHDQLMATEGEIVEDNWWHDNFFGNCFCEDCLRSEGLNHLGRMLMEIRENYRDGYQKEGNQDPDNQGTS